MRGESSPGFRESSSRATPLRARRQNGFFNEVLVISGRGPVVINSCVWIDAVSIGSLVTKSPFRARDIIASTAVRTSTYVTGFLRDGCLVDGCFEPGRPRQRYGLCA